MIRKVQNRIITMINMGEKNNPIKDNIKVIDAIIKQFFFERILFSFFQIGQIPYLQIVHLKSI